MGYQFIHINAYSLTASKGKENDNNVKKIIGEGVRNSGDCDHVEKPKPPIELYGNIKKVEAYCQDWVNNSIDPTGKKIRKDALCLVAGVISIGEEDNHKWEEYKKRSIIFLKEKYGDRLKSVIEHTDESHKHIHFYVVPKIGEKFEDIHQGKKAVAKVKLEFRQQCKEKAKDEKEFKDLLKKGNQSAEMVAFKNSMKDYQEEFYQKVSLKLGFLKYGPKRFRWSRKEYKQRKLDQEKLAEDRKNSRKEAEKLGYETGLKKAENNPVSIISNAIGGFFSGFNSEVKQLQRYIEKLEKHSKKKIEEEKKLAEERLTDLGLKFQEINNKNKDYLKEIKELEKENEELKNNLDSKKISKNLNEIKPKNN